jgi:hypothetical protein
MTIDGADFFARMRGYKKGVDGVPALNPAADRERWSEPSTGEFPDSPEATDSLYRQRLGHATARFGGRYAQLDASDDGYYSALSGLRERAGTGRGLNTNDEATRRTRDAWDDAVGRNHMTDMDKRRELRKQGELLEEAGASHRHARSIMQRVDPNTFRDMQERERLGPLYYLRHPVTGAEDALQLGAERKGKVRDFRTKLAEKGDGTPRTQEELARENALKAAKLGISPKQLEDLNYAKLKANAEYGAMGRALAMGNNRGSGRPSVYRGGASPLSYGGNLGLSNLGGGSSLDMWGRPAQVGRGLKSSYMGNGAVGMWGETRDVSRPDMGIPPMDYMGNPTHDARGKLLPQAPRQMWLPSGAGVSQSGWLPQMQLGSDYLGGFKLGGAATQGGMGGYYGGSGSGMSGFGLNSVGLGGGLGGFSLNGGLGMGRSIGLGDGLGGFGIGDLGNNFSNVGDYGGGAGGFKLGVRGLMDNGDGYLTLGDAYRVGRNGRF